MPLSTRDPWQDNAASLRTFPDHVLVDIARNDAAQHDYRKLAVEVLANRKSPKVKNPEFRPFLDELEIELEGIVFNHPAPSSFAAMTASITTDTLYGSQPIDNTEQFIGFDEVELKETPAVPTEFQSTLPSKIAHAEIQEENGP